MQKNFMELVQIFGLPGAMFLVVIWCLYKGYLVTGREVAGTKILVDIVIAGLQTQLDNLKKESDARISKLEAEKQMWLDMSVEQFKTTSRAIQAARTVAQKLPTKDS